MRGGGGGPEGKGFANLIRETNAVGVTRPCGPRTISFQLSAVAKVNFKNARTARRLDEVMTEEEVDGKTCSAVASRGVNGWKRPGCALLMD